MSKRKRTAEIQLDEDIEDININEITDSEEEYTEHERKLLAKARAKHSPEDYDSDYEVYGLRDENDEDDDEDEDENEMEGENEEEEDDEDKDSMESDIEGLEDDPDLPNEKAWGKKKKMYYSTDYVDPDYSTISEKALAVAEMEEQEARTIQKRLAEQLDDVDFGLDFIEPKEEEEEDDKIEKVTEELVKTDLSKLSKRQKQALMQKESPEFTALVQDFKDRMTEARDVLVPFLKLIDTDDVPDCPAVSYVKTKYHLSLNYCVNISFYLMLKAKRLPVNSHPVIKRLAQYRQLLNQLESGQENLMEEIREILAAKNEGKTLYNISDGSELIIEKPKKIPKIVAQKLKRAKAIVKKQAKNIVEIPKVQPDSVESEKEELENEMSESEKEEDKTEEEDINEETLEDRAIENEGKRAITYQIAKNKGLTPHRKKEQRNPRVKHRNKYRKAKIRRKGAVREVRKEISRYGGEISGIKASVKKSIKLK